MNRINIFVFAVMLLLIGAEAHPQMQRRHSIALGWGCSAPTGARHFRNQFSWLAPRIDWEYRWLPFLSAGLSTGYARSNEQRATRDRFNGDLTDGFTSRQLLLIPLHARLRIFPLGMKTRWQPYIGVSGGLQYASFRITGDFIPTSAERNVGTLVSVGAGIRFYPWKKKTFFAEAGAAWQSAGNTFKRLDIGRQKSVEAHVGVGWHLW